MNGIGYGITPFMGSHGILARSSGGGGGAFVNEYSMSFDGVDEYMNCGTDASLAVTNISISAWIKTSGGSGYQSIISADNANGSYRRYQLTVNNISGCISFFYWNSSLSLKSINGTIIVDDGQWHHIMVVNDGTNLKIYVDGVFDSSNANGGTINTQGTNVITSIGSIYGSYGFFLGTIDEVAVWTSELSASDVTSIYNGGVPTDLTSFSPLSWWRMGDGDTWNGSTWTLTDNGSGGNDATSVNMEEGDRLPISPSSFSLNSFSFDGVDESINIGITPSNLRFNRLDTFSFSAWVKVGTSQGNAILSNQLAPSTNYRGYFFALNNSNQVTVILRSTLSDRLIYTSTTTLTNGVWYHIVFTYDGTATTTGGNIYINNSLDTLTRTGTLTGTMQSTDPLYLGSRDDSDNWFAGNLDEISIFNTELSASDVTTIFNNGTPNDISSLSPISWWRMGEEATWSGSAWTLTDQGSGGNNATSVNMEEADKTGDQPYVI